MASTNPARGMRDFLPADVRKRNYVIGIIKEVYESYGFEPLETPSVENLETLMGKYGDEGNQLVFKILKRGEKLDLEHATKESDLSDLALRYDLTVPLARVVANNKNGLPKFFKRYQIQPVWRADRPARGRFREFYQCDVDCIGSESPVVEAEIIFAACDVLERLGFQDYSVRINHREVLFGLLRKNGVPEDKHIDALVALDKIDKIQREGVEKELHQKGITEETSTKLLNALEFFLKDENSNLTGQEKVATTAPLKSVESYEEKARKAWTNRTIYHVGSDEPVQVNDTLEAYAQKVSRNQFFFLNLYKDLEPDSVAFEGAKNLHAVFENLLANNAATVRVKVDPSLARGLSYYTGSIIEIVLTNGDFDGSIGGGGRYDGLIGMFGKEQIPACGFSLGLERILVVMEERGMFPPDIAESTPADVLVTIWSDETVADSLKLANELRAQGLRVTLYPEADKLGKQFKYADSIKVPFVCVLGETEIAEGKVTVKNLRSGEQQSVDITAVAATIRELGASHQR